MYEFLEADLTIMIGVIHLKELCAVKKLDVVILEVIIDLFDRDKAAAIIVQSVEVLK